MPDCKGCEQKRVSDIPYIAHESTMARFERSNKRLSLALIIAIIALILTNALWIYTMSAYDYSETSTEEITVDGGNGAANFIGNDGDIVNG